ncbi:uncharacterized protein [Coffea arabica]|uniref:Integrase catalytic domain-containing protein n=1 Tax=Coffea arabica TaxID=13443 RepID=A0ABM4VCH8_COFAR
MATDNFVQPAIPRFDGHYDHWSMLMENFLRSKEYWQVVESGVAEPTTGEILSEVQKMELEALKLKDLKAKNYPFQAIDRAILETILSKDTSKQNWDSMKKKYQGNAKAKQVQLQALWTEFETLRMKSSESVTNYFTRTMAIANKMRIHGENLEDVTIVEKILRSMTTKFNFVVCCIEESKDIDAISIDELQSSLSVHEQKINQQEKEVQALKASAESHSTWREGRGRGNNDRGNQQQQYQQQENQFQGRRRGRGGYPSTTQRPKSTDKSNVECYKCHRYGHYQSEFRTNLNRQNGERTNFAEKEEEVSLLMVCHMSKETQQNMWYLDTGCSNHMCGDKKTFSELDESFRSTVKFGDNSTISVMGKGRKKSEAFSTFKNFMTLIEKEAGKSIKFFRSDCGGEYNSQEFINFCEKYGIQKQLTAAYMPQQNGVSERKNRTILNMVRSILTKSGVPKNFWPETVNWSIHMLNKSPTFAVKNMTPEEAWSGRKPTVDHFKFFGCIVYAHVPEQKRTKLDNKGEKYIFLGVSDQSKAYKLYNPITKKIITSRDVIFDEENFWPWSSNIIKQQIPADFDGVDEENRQQLTEQIPQQAAVDKTNSTTSSS